jgi:uncharacterized membrane protein
VYALFPWVIFGGFLRVVEDTGMPGHGLGMIFTTPLIFFFILGIAAPTLWGLWKLETAGLIKNFKQYFAVIGAGSALIVLAFLIWFGITESTFDPRVAGIILLMAGITTSLVYLLIRYLFRWEYVSDRLYQMLIFGHMLDASATSYGIDLHAVPYVEQHVVGSFLIGMTGTAFVMFPLKLAVIIPGIWILEQYRRNEHSGIWYLILLAMIMVGMAPGIRDMMRMVLYV